MGDDGVGTVRQGQERRRRRSGLPLGVATGFVAGALVTGAGAAWAGHQFSDVPDTHPFHDEIDWMVDNGIAEGYADGTYKPANPVSRQAFAAFLQRYNDRIVVKQEVKDPVNGQIWAFTVQCDAGMRAVGGGGHGVTNMVVAGSYPQSASTWRVDFQSINGTFDPASAVVHAFCVPA